MRLKAYEHINKEIEKKCGPNVIEMGTTPPEYEKWITYHKCYKKAEKELVPANEQKVIDNLTIQGWYNSTDCL